MPARPANVIVVLLDSLNRHMLGAYGGAEFETPNLDRFARRAVQFDKHFVGSLPCMPARHDVLCGALDFLWKPWGSIELWEEPITQPLRRAGVTTMLSPIVRTSSNPVARTITPTFARGNICGGTKAIRGKRGLIRRGSARLLCRQPKAAVIRTI
jgi:hypothetical protein